MSKEDEKNGQYPTISRSRYEAMLSMGISYQGWVEEVGFVLKEVVVVGRATNRSQTQFSYDLQTVQTVIPFKQSAEVQLRDNTNMVINPPIPFEKSTEEFPWYNHASRSSALLGVAGVPISDLGGTFRITSGAKYGFQLSPKYYASGWGGGTGARIKTFKATNLAKGLGAISFGATALSSTIGMIQYYNNPQSINAVSYEKGVFDVGMGWYSLYFAGPGALYFLVDAFIGWDQVIRAGALLKQEEKKAAGDNYNKWWYPRVQIH